VAESDPVTLAVVASQIGDLREDIRDLRSDLSNARAGNVSRGEWVQRNSNVDTRFQNQGREIGELRTELRSRRAPWWSVAALFLSAIAVLWTILGPPL
jgi:hypothetical protein